MSNQKMFNANTQSGRIHPLIATAAVAVTLVSLIGVAAITGILPSSNSTTTPVAALAAPTPAAMPPMAPAAVPLASQPQQLASQTLPETQSPAYVAIPDPEPSNNADPKPAKPRVQAPPPKAVKHHASHPVREANQSPMYQPQYQPQQPYRTVEAPAVCNNCGRVESVVAIRQPAHGSGLGVAAGAVIGGVLGNQVGGGNGRTLATVAGAVAGGFGGNEVEKRTRATTAYEARVRMEDGEMRTVPLNGADGFRVGDNVRVVNGALTSR